MGSFEGEIRGEGWSVDCATVQGGIRLVISSARPRGSGSSVLLSQEQSRAVHRLLGRALGALDRRRPSGTGRAGGWIDICELWDATDESVWNNAIAEYWRRSDAGKNAELERSMDKLKLERLRRMSPQEWYLFLRDEYFRWKFTAPNRYTTTTGELAKWNPGRLEQLDALREQLLKKSADLKAMLKIADSIPGLGAAGASGLLALMYPREFATVDQFAVKALTKLGRHSQVAKMNPKSLTINNAVTLIQIMRDKAQENRRRFRSSRWTPRMIDMALWVCR